VDALRAAVSDSESAVTRRGAKRQLADSKVFTPLIGFCRSLVMKTSRLLLVFVSGTSHTIDEQISARILHSFMDLACCWCGNDEDAASSDNHLQEANFVELCLEIVGAATSALKELLASADILTAAEGVVFMSESDRKQQDIFPKDYDFLPAPPGVHFHQIKKHCSTDLDVLVKRLSLSGLYPLYLVYKTLSCLDSFLLDNVDRSAVLKKGAATK
jgi:hypothetical protein